MAGAAGQLRPVQQPPQQAAPFPETGEALGKRVEKNDRVPFFGEMTGQVVGKDPDPVPSRFGR